ncbi:MAG: ArsR/SmtB family transcription factor [Pseudonocardiaceae bacterium]
MTMRGNCDPGKPAGGGDADLSVIGSILADRSRCKILLALADGRALPASMLAVEAGVSAATTSAHLHKLCAAGLLEVFPQGRYRYYRLAGDEVGRLIESVAQFSPTQPVRSLREGTRAHAIRLARCCYNHVAGRLGVAVTAALIEQGCLTGGDGSADLGGAHRGRLAGGVRDEITYQLTANGRSMLGELGVILPAEDTVRCCVDWTEQRHHIAGRLGRALLDAFTGTGWLRRAEHSRALIATEAGKRGLHTHLGVCWPPAAVSAAPPAPSRPGP